MSRSSYAILTTASPGWDDWADLAIVPVREEVAPLRAREVPARVADGAVTPLPVEPLAPLYSGLVGAVTAYEHLALDAALRGGRERGFEALLAHTLVGQIELAEGLTDRLIAHNADYLPWA